MAGIHSVFVADFNAFVKDFDVFVTDSDTFVKGFNTFVKDFDTFVTDFDTFVKDFDTFVKMLYFLKIYAILLCRFKVEECRVFLLLYFLYFVIVPGLLLHNAGVFVCPTLTIHVKHRWNIQQRCLLYFLVFNHKHYNQFLIKSKF